MALARIRAAELELGEVAPPRRSPKSYDPYCVTTVTDSSNMRYACRVEDPLPFIVRFEDRCAVDPCLSGGKGVNLARMSQAGLPVPPGFAVTTGPCAVTSCIGRETSCCCR